MVSDFVIGITSAAADCATPATAAQRADRHYSGAEIANQNPPDSRFVCYLFPTTIRSAHLVGRRNP
jgi:hypothetical protein